MCIRDSFYGADHSLASFTAWPLYFYGYFYGADHSQGLSWRERLASSDESLLAKMARVEATLGLSGASQPLVARVAAAQRAVGLPPQGNSLRLQLDAIVAAVEGRR